MPQEPAQTCGNDAMNVMPQGPAQNSRNGTQDTMPQEPAPDPANTTDQPGPPKSQSAAANQRLCLGVRKHWVKAFQWLATFHIVNVNK
ncbi:hypothetical protein EB796_001982 [Bugula neritina]|uniref:Uncharacterized protein n=1 Tax=Bugula neritina TaxID=10212 RepID=A0A7J7KNH1_BUGNE|nr:hypothetical protein EB796_001982 [Bugula neritina]